jgi:hypothetical protein
VERPAIARHCSALSLSPGTHWTECLLAIKVRCRVTQRSISFRAEKGQIEVNQIGILGFLIVATVLEATGDAVVRMGIAQHAWAIRCLLFLAGAILLFGYGLSLNLAPTEFRRVVGSYVATLFVVWQIVNFAAFRSLPNTPILVGGALIVVGGAIVTFW